jgi:uncharacterized membrane protein
MDKLIRVAMTQACCVLVVVLYGMGRSWIDGEIGLHPILAGVGICLFLLIPYVVGGDDG